MKREFIIVWVWIAVFFVGCGGAVEQNEEITDRLELTEESFEHNGVQRNYLLFIPKGLPENAPLVFVFHGFTSSAKTIMEYSKFNELAKEKGFAVVYPDGTKDANNNSFWNVGYEFHDGLDVKDSEFVIELVSFLHVEYGFSKVNTFATGMSNGGDMCYLLACEHSNTFNAVAPIAGTMMNSLYESCNPKSAIPIMAVVGTADETTKFNGDEEDKDGWGAYKSIPSIVELWTNNIDIKEIKIDTLPNISEQDSSIVVRKLFASTSSNNDFLYYEIIGGEHDWPGAWGNEDLNTTNEIWSFFSKSLVVE